MRTATQDRAYERRVQIVLEDSAAHLTSRELQEIARIAEEAHAAVHISFGSWQVLIGVPEIYHQDIAETLRNMGYECDIHAGELEISTFVLKERKEMR